MLPCPCIDPAGRPAIPDCPCTSPTGRPDIPDRRCSGRAGDDSAWGGSCEAGAEIRKFWTEELFFGYGKAVERMR